MELHVHLVGSASPATIAELASSHPAAGVPAADSLRTWLRFADFAGFAHVYGTVTRLVRRETDILTLVRGLSADLAACNVRYAEVTVTPLSHLAVGIAPVALAEALAVGRRQAARECGVELAWVFDVSGDLGVEAAVETVRWIETYGPDGTVAFGLGGPEAGVPRSQFKPAFEMAVSAGLHSVPHAGEAAGPESVWSALEDLRAERIGHGVRAVDDSALLRRLVETGVTLEVCPTSNVATGQVASLPDHQLPRLLEAGVPVSLATDNPGLFGTDLNREYRLCHDALSVDRAGLVAMAMTGVNAAFCAPALKRQLSEQIRESVARDGSVSDGTT